MAEREHSVDLSGDGRALAREIRVHGVGGPQAPKMLGVLDESDTETLPQIGPGKLFRDGKSRLVRRIGDDEVVAYEWGGLTVGSLLNALWVAYLPLTVLNAAGWAQPPGGGRRNRAVIHVLCALGTLTYVAWFGYFTLDLVGRQWRDRLVQADLPELVEDAVEYGLLPLAHVLFLGLLALLWVANRRSSKAFEEASLGEPASSWKETGAVRDPGFFEHVESYGRLRARHQGIAVAGVLAVIALGFFPRELAGAQTVGSVTSIGLGIVLLATAQGLVLVGLWLPRLFGGPTSQAIFATLGTVLCHAAFAGGAIAAVQWLAQNPKGEAGGRSVIAGAELGFSDAFFLALAAAALLCGFAVWRIRRRKEAGAYPTPPALVTKVVARVTVLGALISLSFVGAFVVLFLVHLADLNGSVVGWYEGYRARQNVAQQWGGRALGALALAMLAVLWKPRDGVMSRLVGNVWDVLTFWPRRFHPFAAPPYAERAVPELRHAIRSSRGPQPVVVAAHSQGSVLSFAAVAQELCANPGQGTVSLLTFGSPLGSLFGRAFPAYFGPDDRAAVAEAIAQTGGSWWNLYRPTDAISGPLVAGGGRRWYEEALADPRCEGGGRTSDVPPLERPRPWFAKDGHNYYLAHPRARELLVQLRLGGSS